MNATSAAVSSRYIDRTPDWNAEIMLYEILKLAADKPRCIFECMNLLTTRLSDEIDEKYLRQSVQRQFETKESVGLGRVESISIGGREYFLKVYTPALLPALLRNLKTSHVAREAGIIVPRVVQECFTKVNGQACFILLIDKLPGHEVGYRSWSREEAASLATTLARWHAIKKDSYGTLGALLNKYTKDNYIQRLSKRPAAGREPDVRDGELIDTAIRLLDDEGMLNDSRISHGDVNVHNIFMADGQIMWVDLDSTAIRPPWHDLAIIEAEIFLRQRPEVIDAFEQTYFDVSQTDRDAWIKNRIKWYVLYNVIEAVKWIAVDKAKGRGRWVTGEETYVTWAKDKFDVAAAALAADGKESEAGKVIGLMKDWLDAQAPQKTVAISSAPQAVRSGH